MIQRQALDMVSKLIGLPAWGPQVGPAGMTLQFGRKSVVAGVEEGDLSLWIKCEVKISGEGLVYVSRRWPTPENIKEQNQYFESAAVLKAGIDERNNSLRVLLRGERLLSVYPAHDLEAGCWILFDHTMQPSRRCLALFDSIEIEEEQT